MADQGAPERTDPVAGPALTPGTHVEVQSSFDGTWSSGFVVESVTAAGYHLLRESDGAVLPELPHERVRRRRRRSTWWV